LSQENDRLKQELAKKDEQIAGLTKRVEELDKQKPASKSRQQALQALELLNAGPVSQAQLKALNDKYPSDPIYYVRSILKLDVKTVRSREGKLLHASGNVQGLLGRSGEGESSSGSFQTRS
jgi:hypothetical protein